jgi:hypothetical protein
MLAICRKTLASPSNSVATKHAIHALNTNAQRPPTFSLPYTGKVPGFPAHWRGKQRQWRLRWPPGAHAGPASGPIHTLALCDCAKRWCGGSGTR